jgi:hypothetical protein
MKKWSTRTKRIVAIFGGIAALVVVALLVLNLSGVIGVPLAGTARNAYIWPSELCIRPNDVTLGFDLFNYGLRTTWSIGDTNVAYLVPQRALTAVVPVAQGETWVQVKGLVQILDKGLVHVRTVCPHKYQLRPNTSTVMKTSLTGGQWSSSDPSIVRVDQTGRILATGTHGQQAVITYTSPNGSGSSIITVDNNGNTGQVGW